MVNEQELKQAKKEAFKELVNDKNVKLDIILSNEKKPLKCMAIGENNNHYYFGTILTDGFKRIPAIITDTGEIFCKWKEKLNNEWIVNNEIKDKFGLEYRYELFEEVVDNLWSNASIKKFKNGEVKQETIKGLFEEIKKLNEEYIYHPDKRVHIYIACDIISNYFYPLFNAKGRTYFQADFSSGKSRQSKIFQLLSFNSLFASNISPAAFERVIESTGGTLIVDNFDNINEDLKKEILQVIEVYYKKGGKNIKASGYKNKPEAFNGYSPLVINNIVGLPEVTTSRCNKIQMLKTDIKNIVDKKINEKDLIWRDIKDRLHICALQNWKEVMEKYEKLEVSKLSARDLERTEAVLTIAKVCGEDTYNELLSFILHINEQESMKELHDNWEFILFEFLHKAIKQGETKDIKIQEITACVGDKIVTNDKNEKKDKLKFSHYCGKILSGIPLFKGKIINGWKNYEISREHLDKILKVKGYDKYLTQHNPTTPTPPNHTQQHHTSPTTPNNIINNNNQLKLSEVSDVK